MKNIVKIFLAVIMVLQCITSHATYKSYPNGSYEGALVNGIREGFGSMTYKNGDSYRGDWKNDRKEGDGFYKWKTGGYVSGKWAGGKLNGESSMILPNNERYEGNFSDGKMTGYGEYTWASGAKYEGEFIDGARSGQGKMTFPDGSQYSGEWMDDKINGFGIFRSSQGFRYEGDFKDGVFEGKGLMTYKDKISYEGQWKAGLRNGTGVVTFPGGKTFEAAYQNDAIVSLVTNEMLGYGRELIEVQPVSLPEIEQVFHFSFTVEEDLTGNQSYGSNRSKGMIQVIDNPSYSILDDYMEEDDIRIVSVELSKSGTVVTLYIPAKAKDHSYNIDNETVIIYQAGDKKKSLLLDNASGIAIGPVDSTFVAAGRELHFRLFFPPIPKDVTHFDLIEREADELRNNIIISDMEFFNIDLRLSNRDISRQNIGRVKWDSIYTEPTFCGRDKGYLTTWVNAKLKYPEKARNRGLEGSVRAYIYIDTTGNVTEVRVCGDVDDTLKDEARRVLLATSGLWTPRIHDGIRYNTTIPFSIEFKLK